MRVELSFSDLTGIRLQPFNYDPELDDIRSILRDVCRCLEQRGQFIVSGFGQDHWPVDIGTDLVVFLEQLPRILYAIKEFLPIELDFYEQGIQRTLTFSPDSSQYLVTCRSQTDWQPSPEAEVIDCMLLQRMLLNVRENFMHAVNEIAPELKHHSWMKSWLDESMDASV